MYSNFEFGQKMQLDIFISFLAPVIPTTRNIIMIGE